MRNGSNGPDLSEDGMAGGYIGINCKLKDEAFNPATASNEQLKRLEDWNTWSRNQLTNFIRLREDDVVLLSKKDSRFLCVGTVTNRPPYLERDDIPLRLRRRMKWINQRYARDNLLGFGYFGQASLTPKRKLNDYVDDIKMNRVIRVEQIQYSDSNKVLARREVRKRFEALFPSYFEDLVRFVAEQSGLQVDYFVKTKSNDAGIDLGGWRSKELLTQDLDQKERFCIQVKRRKVGEEDVSRLRRNLAPGETGILVSSETSDLPEKRRDLFADGRLRLVDGDLLADYVLEFHEKLPTHLAAIFKIIKLE